LARLVVIRGYPALLGFGLEKFADNKSARENDPNWFQKDGKPFYLQTDFVWSIPFRGRSEAAAPPSRCNF
jgi:hypothetical protein